jgi:hypothetical protein
MARPDWTPPSKKKVDGRTLGRHPPLRTPPRYRSRVLGPEATAAEKLEQVDKWMSDMVTWGKRVRHDIVRLEVWLARTRQEEGCRPAFWWNDPGEPPAKPWV